jgi:DNA repair ATPase RecN
MNKERRKRIETAIKSVEGLEELIHGLTTALSEIQSEIESIRDEEQEYLDNMPEAMQSGSKGEVAQDAINNLGSAYEPIDSLLSTLEEFSSESVTTDLSEAAA